LLAAEIVAKPADAKNYALSLSVTIVLVEPASVIVVREEELLLVPLKIATSSNITITPPTIHTQGAAYHSVCDVVVVVFIDVLELPLVLSCGELIRQIKQNVHVAVMYFQKLPRAGLCITHLI